METVERAVAVNGLAFVVRAWKSATADGWFWSAYAEDHPWAESGTRPWANARLATEAAVARLERLVGEAANAGPEATMPKALTVPLGGAPGAQACRLLPLAPPC